MTAPEHWAGDCGDVVAALWHPNLDAFIRTAMRTTYGALGTMLGIDLNAALDKFDEIIPEPIPVAELFAEHCVDEGLSIGPTDPAQYTATAGPA